MSIWNKVLVGFILVASVVFFFLAARVLKTHAYWRSIAVKLEADLKVEQELEKELRGDSNKPDAPPGIRQLKVALRGVLVDRGRVWRNCEPGIVQPSGNLSVTTGLAEPKIAVNTVLFAFEEKPIQDGGRYLGQFSVAGVAGNLLQLQPSMELYDEQLKRLQDSSDGAVRWSLYEIMPVDQHEIFAEMDEAELHEMFPESTADEYIVDRSTAAPGGPEVQQPDRQLRDYEVLFAEYGRQWGTRRDESEAATRDIASLEAALADTRLQVQFRQNEIDQLNGELVEITGERDTVATHCRALEKMLAVVEAGVEKIIATNRALAGQIARIQQEATQRIDEQTRRMAQAGRGS